jgi:hypothetical protein
MIITTIIHPVDERDGQKKKVRQANLSQIKSGKSGNEKVGRYTE